MKKEIKKIQLIERFFYPVGAGIETNMLETYSVLAKRGWDITVHTSKDTLIEKNVLSDDEEYRGLKIKRYVFGKFGFFPQIDWNNSDAVCLHNFNVIPHFYILAYSLLLKLLKRKKHILILTPHGGFNPEWSVFPQPQRYFKQLYHFTIGKTLVNWVVDGVRAVSNWEAQQMISKGIDNNKIIVISNGVEDEAYMDVNKLASKEVKANVKSYGDYIIQIGRIYIIKNYETTIRALAQTKSKLKYIIAGPIGSEIAGKAGSNSYVDMLKNLAKELHVEDRVIFLGTIRGVDKYYLIKHAKMMVHMALWESFCNVVHEGLSQGLICIVANNTALPYLIKDNINGYIVDTFDYKSVAQKIDYVFKNLNSPELEEMAKRNRKFGLEMSWRKVSEKMFDFYESTYSKLKI